MQSFESEVKAYLDSFEIPYEDFGRSTSKPDLFIDGKYWLELKEKRNPINPKNWPIMGDGKNIVIIDELTVRRLTLFSPNVFVAFRDNPRGRLYIVQLFELLFMPRIRVNRPVDGKEHLKGKWLLDVRNWHEVTGTHEMLKFMESQDWMFVANRYSECFGGEFVGERIITTGNPRKQHYQNYDFLVTR